MVPDVDDDIPVFSVIEKVIFIEQQLFLLCMTAHVQTTTLTFTPTVFYSLLGVHHPFES